MSDRRRRRLEDEGEDEAAADTSATSTETETSSGERKPARVSECESEADSADVELSECDSESAADDGGDQDETEDCTESETEEGSETEEITDSGTETEGGDYTDEEELDGERESGDGEEQPEGDKPDDDEDRKNPAYVPRKGAFYEHDFRDGIEGEEEAETPESPEQAKAKKKLWQDEGKWSHDHYKDDLQAPKSREELIAIYGYDIRAADKPPEMPPRKPRRQRDGPRREKKFNDYLPRMAVIDTTEYGEDAVPNIDQDGMITYKDSVSKTSPRSNNNNSNVSDGSNRRRGRGGGRGGGGRGQWNRPEEDETGGEANSKPYQRRDERNITPQPQGGRAIVDDFPSLQEATMRVISTYEDEPSSMPVRSRKSGGHQEKNRYKESSYQQDSGNNRYRDSHQNDRYNRDSNQDNNRYRDSHQDGRYRDSEQDNSRYRGGSYQDNNRYRDSNQDGGRYGRDSHQQDSPYREQDNRYRNSNQYNEDRTNSYGDGRRGGYRGGGSGSRGRGSNANYRQQNQSQDVRQHEARMNEDNSWGNRRDRDRDGYDNNGPRKDGRYSNNKSGGNRGYGNDDIRQIIIQEDYNNAQRYKGTRSEEAGNRNYKSQQEQRDRGGDYGSNNRQQRGSGENAAQQQQQRRSTGGHDDYNSAAPSKRGGNHRSYEQPPRYQQQQQHQHQQQSNRESREFTNTSYRADDRGPGSQQDPILASPYTGPGETGDAANGAPVVTRKEGQPPTAGSQPVERKSYAKERRAKGAGGAIQAQQPTSGVKDKTAAVSAAPLDSTGTATGHPQQYINAAPRASTETASAPSSAGSKRYSSQRQQGLSKGNYSEPPPVERGANLYNPALPPPSFYQRDPTKGGQTPSSSPASGVADAPHFNPSILPPGSTALPYHLPAVPQPGIQIAGGAATAPPPRAVFQQPPQGPPPHTAPTAATLAAQPGPAAALIAPPYIPPGTVIYGGPPTAPPRVPPPGTPAAPARISLPFAYTAPPPHPPAALPGNAPAAAVVSSQSEQIAVLASGQQGPQPAGQPKKVYRGDITYYAPEFQFQQPSRTPQKRPKSAIPIVDPQEMRRLKELDARRGDRRSHDREDYSKSAHHPSGPTESITHSDGSERVSPSHPTARRASAESSYLSPSTTSAPTPAPAEAPKPQRSSRPERQPVAATSKDQHTASGTSASAETPSAASQREALATTSVTPDATITTTTPAPSTTTTTTTSPGSANTQLPEKPPSSSRTIPKDAAPSGVSESNCVSSSSSSSSPPSSSSSSLPVAVDSMKNDVLQVSRELPAVEKIASVIPTPTAGVKVENPDQPSPSSSSSLASEVVGKVKESNLEVTQSLSLSSSSQPAANEVVVVPKVEESTA